MKQIAIRWLARLCCRLFDGFSRSLIRVETGKYSREVGIYEWWFLASKKKFRASPFLMIFTPLLMTFAPSSNAAEENSQSEITIVRGEQYEICQDYAAELREHNVSSSNYCGIAIPLDNPNYRLPEWTDLNPSENMELVKAFYYWRNMGSSRTHELFAQQEAHRGVITRSGRIVDTTYFLPDWAD